MTLGEYVVLALLAVNVALTFIVWRLVDRIREVVEEDVSINLRSLEYVSAPKPPPFAHIHGPVK